MTGAIPDTDTPDNRIYPTDGHIPIGMAGTFLDPGSDSVINLLKSNVTNAGKTGGRTLVRFHPVSIDDGKQITTDRFLAFLDWLKAEQDAGRIMIVTLREWAIAQN